MSEPEQETPDEPVTPLEGPEHDPAPDEDGEPGDEPAAPEAPVEAPVEAQEAGARMEEVGKQLDALNKTVATRLGRILGDDAIDLDPCPWCSYFNTPGHVFRGVLPNDLRTHIAHLIGERAPEDFEKDSYSRACDKCRGLGETLTGSKVPGRERLPCYDCSGNGWIAVGNERASTVLSRANGPASAVAPLGPADVAMQPAPTVEPAEAAALRAQGYIVVPPVTVP